MVSLTGSMFFLANAPHGFTGSARFSIWSTDTTSSFCYNQRKVLCACMAPPRNIGSDEYRATKFNDSYKSKQLGTVLEREDDSDVLIECKNVYKSFGDEDILRGVSFKVGGLGDVVTGLGKALKKRGHLVEIILPKYDCMQYDGIGNLRALDVVLESYFDGNYTKTKYGLASLKREFESTANHFQNHEDIRVI